MVNNQKNKEFFSQLYDKHADEIYRFVLLRVNSPETAEDLTSEIFLKSWQYLVSHKASLDAPRAFFYQIARNLVVDFYRKKRTEAILVDDSEKVYESQRDIKFADFSFDLAGQFQDVKHTPIGEALFKLKNEHKEILTLRYVDDLSISEIAKILKKNPVATRVAIHRALKLLRQTIETEETDRNW